MRVLIAAKETVKEFLGRKYGQGNLARACSEQGKDINNVMISHEQHHNTLESLVNAFTSRDIIPSVRARVDTPDYPAYSIDDFKAADIVVSFGGDGEVLDVARNITRKALGKHKPPVWVEPADPLSVAAFGEKSNRSYNEKVDLLINNSYREESWARLKGVIKIKDRVMHEDIALNDVAVGKKYFQSMARYTISADGKQEYQMSSGIVISTQPGLTGWLLNIAPYDPVIEKQLMDGTYRCDLTSKKLSYKTINPPIQTRRACRMLSGEVREGGTITVTSAMNYSGTVAFDGSDPDCPEPRCYDFNRGMVLEVCASDDPLKVIRFDDYDDKVKGKKCGTFGGENK